MEVTNKHVIRSNKKMATLPDELKILIDSFDHLVRAPLEHLPQVGMTLAIEYHELNGEGGNKLEKHYKTSLDQIADYFTFMIHEHERGREIREAMTPTGLRAYYNNELTRMLSQMTTLIIAAACLQIQSFEAACEQLHSINEEKEQ